MNDCCTSSSSQGKRQATGAAALAKFAVRPGVTFPDWSALTSPVVRDALQATVGSSHVLNRWSGYGPLTDRVRVALLQLYAEDGRAPSPCALAERTGLNETVISSQLEELRRRDLVVLDGARVIDAYPFSDRDTGHWVTLDGRVLNAICAIDALGAGAMTSSDATIASHCRPCGAPIRITTRHHGRALADIEPATAVMWQSVRYENACAENSLCATTVFFRLAPSTFH